MDLREATHWLLGAKDIGRWLALADNYIQMRNKVPDTFVLPADHAVLRPVIEAFASDIVAFAEYLRALRDEVTGIQYDELHALYRTISVRGLQVIRRTRLRKAVLLLQPAIEAALARPTTYNEQLEAARVIEQDWGAARMQLLERERRNNKNGRLSSEERAAILDAYWADIDKKLSADHVPLHSDTMNNIIETLNR